MKNLLNIGISETTLDKMIENNSYSLVEDLDFNSENVLEIINYLKKYMITDNTINNLLINSIDIFFLKSNTIIEKLDNSEMKELINEINKDYSILLDFIF